MLDEDDPRDSAFLQSFLDAFGGMDFAVPRAILAARLLRGLAREPRAMPRTVGWATRAQRRAGGLSALRAGSPRAITYVMHAFMDARVVRPAWEALQAGTVPTDPGVHEAWERLQACSYAMAHPDDGTLVPACAQHAVLDPAENARLTQLLPLHSG